jgi:hypothetical protein
LLSGLVDHVYDVPECNNGDDYMAIYETIDRKRQVSVVSIAMGYCTLGSLTEGEG